MNAINVNNFYPEYTNIALNIEIILKKYLILLYKYIISIKTNYENAKRTKTLIISPPIQDYINILNNIIQKLGNISLIFNEKLETYRTKIFQNKGRYNGGRFPFPDKSKHISPIIDSILQHIGKLNKYIDNKLLSNITTDKQKYTPDNQYKFLIILTIMNNLLFLLNKLKENIKYKTDKYNIKIQYIQPNSITNKGKTKNFGIKSSVIPRGGTKKLIKKPTKN